MSESVGRVDLSQVVAGMDLCSSDFKKWGEISGVHRPSDGGPEFVIGTVDASGQQVYVPAGDVLELHGECLRLNRELAHLDEAGFDRRPDVLPGGGGAGA